MCEPTRLPALPGPRFDRQLEAVVVARGNGLLLRPGAVALGGPR